MSTRPMIEAKGLVKSYGAVHALVGLDLSVEKGSILALLGPNGAGKTTVVRILTTRAVADAGSAQIAGYDVHAQATQVRRHIGVTAQDVTLDGLLTGYQNLVMAGELSGLKRSAAIQRANDLLGPVRPDRRRRPAGQGVLGRHAPAARPGRQPGSEPARPVPGRTHHRARPHQPGRGLGDRAGTDVAGRHRAPHHPVPRRGRKAGRAGGGRGPWPRYCRRISRRTEALSWGCPARDHVERRFRRRRLRRQLTARRQPMLDGSSCSTAAHARRPFFSQRPFSYSMVVSTRRRLSNFDGRRDGTANEVTKALAPFLDGPVRVSDGGRRISAPVSSRSGLATMVVRALDSAGLSVDDVEVHQPSLDDVFFALTGRPAESEDDQPELEEAVV